MERQSSARKSWEDFNDFLRPFWAVLAVFFLPSLRKLDPDKVPIHRPWTSTLANLTAVLNFYRWVGPIAVLWVLFFAAGDFAELAGVEVRSESYSAVFMLVSLATMPLVFVGVPFGLVVSVLLLRGFAANPRIFIPAVLLLVSSGSLVFMFATLFIAPPPEEVETVLLYVSFGSLLLFGVSATFVGWILRRS